MIEIIKEQYMLRPAMHGQLVAEIRDHTVSINDMVSSASVADSSGG